MAFSAYRQCMARQAPGWRVRMLGQLKVVAMLAAALVLSAAPTLAAQNKNAVLVVDGNTGSTLYASNADEPRYPASLTKMMTLYMTFDLIERGRLSYQTKIKVSAAAAGAAPSKLDLKEGDEIALIDAIRALITKSANDVAIAIAEHIAGSEDKFARLMTARAHQIGMTRTTFRNASGLPDPQQVTTARDMATLALRLQDDFPLHYVLFSTKTFSYRGETFTNHNSLLLHYEGTDGIKTGYTRASGFNLVSSVRRGRKHVIGVVFGGASAASRNQAMRTFLNIGLVKASTEKTRRPAAPAIASAPHGHNAPQPAPRVAAAAAPRANPKPQPMPEAARQPEAAPVQPAGVAMVRVRTMPVPPRAEAVRAVAAADPAPRASGPSRAPAAVATPAPPSAAPLGAPPSTLDAQAVRLSRGAPPSAPAYADARAAAPYADVRASARRPASDPVASATPGRAHVQIGAFPSAVEAERQLAAVRARGPAALAHAKPMTQQVQQGEKTLYRARYAGLDPTVAAQACEDLKKQGVACMVFRGE